MPVENFEMIVSPVNFFLLNLPDFRVLSTALKLI